VLLEAPHRLTECLDDLAAAFGDRPCVVCRELTKLHEEVERGTVTGFAARFAAQPPVGEFVIILDGAGGAEAGPSAPRGVSFEEAVSEARGLVAGGQRKKDAAKLVEKKHRLRPGTIYRALSRAREKGDA
jgi:16S rRNA (cytidine1402-2'-O)-methyltransferase